MIESIQMKYTKKFKSMGRIEYRERLLILGITSLEDRRFALDLKFLHMMTKNDSQFLERMEIMRNVLSITNKGNRYIHKRRMNKVTQNEYSCRIIPIWNNLPTNIKNNEKTKKFMEDLQKWLKNLISE